MKRDLSMWRGVMKAVAMLLVSVMLCVSFAGCSQSVKDPIMEYGDHKISLAFYEFMLSRMKGELARQKYDVDSMSSFWSQESAATGQTREQYYNDTVLDRCKNYLAALVLFDGEGLELSADELAEIEAEIAFYIDYDGQGSEKKLNAILAKYGADIDELRQIYTVEAKYRKLTSLLYGADGSLISDAVKQEFYEQNYYRFKQIFVSNFYYEYQTDEQGNVIYFDPETSKPIYDKENGKVIYVDGYSVKDQYGNPIYYDEHQNILYDTEKGYPTPILDGNGEAVTYEYTDAEMADRVARMKALTDSLKNGNYSAFEAEMPYWELYDGSDEYYKDGYYLSRIESFGYQQYMLDILEALEDMREGEIRTVESKFGYHIVMKYKLDEGKFNDVEYAEWFASFNESLQNKLFLDKCARFYADIKLCDENVKKARSIKQMGVNYNY